MRSPSLQQQVVVQRKPRNRTDANESRKSSGTPVDESQKSGAIRAVDNLKEDRPIARTQKSASLKPALRFPATPGTFLNAGAGNVEIGGGHLTNAGRDVNFHFHGKEDSVRSQVSPVLAGVGINLIQKAIEGSCSLSMNRPRITSGTQGGQTAIRDGQVLYQELLLPRARGFPLWRPHPSDDHPELCRQQGFGIGDVGVINEFGDFEFLFNACARAEDPINPTEMPEGFEPFVPALGFHSCDIDEGSSVTSESVMDGRTKHISNPLFPTAFEYAFESDAFEGAMLTIPQRGRSENIRNADLQRFKAYAAKHAKNWNRYAKDVRMLCPPCCDLCVITGCDKTARWGMATFSNPSHNDCCFTFKPSFTDTRHLAYYWDHSGTAHASRRTGPKSPEPQGSQGDDAAEVQGPYLNQCIFIRTINVTLKDDVLFDTPLMTTTVPSQSEGCNTGQDNVSGAGPLPCKKRIIRPRAAARTPTGTWRPSQREPDGSNKLNDLLREQRFPQINHPSHAINRLLLGKYPDAQVAVTHDQDWCVALLEGELILPEPHQLLQNILSLHEILRNDGVVSLCLKGNPVDFEYDALVRSCGKIEELSIDKVSSRTAQILEDAVDQTPQSFRLVLFGIFYLRKYTKVFPASLDVAVALAEDEARSITKAGLQKLREMGGMYLPPGVQGSHDFSLPASVSRVDNLTKDEARSSTKAHLPKFRGMSDIRLPPLRRKYGPPNSDVYQLTLQASYAFVTLLTFVFFFIFIIIFPFFFTFHSTSLSPTVTYFLSVRKLLICFMSCIISHALRTSLMNRNREIGKAFIRFQAVRLSEETRKVLRLDVLDMQEEYSNKMAKDIVEIEDWLQSRSTKRFFGNYNIEHDSQEV